MSQQQNDFNSFALIEEMINKAKNNFSESGTLFLIWGFVILVCSLVHFTAAYFFNNQNFSVIWMLTWAASIFQIFYLKRKARQKKVKTYTDDVLKYMWIVFFICMVLMVFILIWQKAFYSINPAILVLYGIPTFLTGIILRFRPLIIGGICCWLLSIGSVLTHWHFQLLYIAGAGIAAWIIPGFYLRQKYLKENSNNGR